MTSAPLGPLLIHWYPLWPSHVTPWAHFLDTPPHASHMLVSVSTSLHSPSPATALKVFCVHTCEPFSTLFLGSLFSPPPSCFIHPLLWLHPVAGHFLEGLHHGNHKIHTSHSLTTTLLCFQFPCSLVLNSGSSVGPSSSSTHFFALHSL